MTIASSLMGECGLSHECEEDGCKGTCVKFGAENLTKLGICKSDSHRKINRPVMG